MPLSILAYSQESLQESYQLLQESLAVARETGDQWAIADALLHTGDKAHAAGEYEKAAQNYQEAVQQFRQNGDLSGVGASLHKLSLIAIDCGRSEEALAIAQEIMPLVRDFMPIHSFRALGYALIALGSYEEAEAQFQQGLAFIGEPEHNTRDLLFGLGWAAFGVGEYARAAQQFQESLAEALEIDDLAYVAQNHDALGRLNLAQGNDIRAREHLLAALQAGIPSGQPPLILDCMATAAELFLAEGNLEYAALLALQVAANPASRAKIKERAARLLTRLEAELSADVLASIHLPSRLSDLDAVAAQLLVDLKSP
jgi:tetratricopeptide (TPR) repeat protein